LSSESGVIGGRCGGGEAAIIVPLPDANVIVPGRNYTALVDLGREDERA
jgi:hypothetical protein